MHDTQNSFDSCFTNKGRCYSQRPIRFCLYNDKSDSTYTCGSLNCGYIRLIFISQSFPQFPSDVSVHSHCSVSFPNYKADSIFSNGHPQLSAVSARRFCMTAPSLWEPSPYAGAKFLSKPFNCQTVIAVVLDGLACLSLRNQSYFSPKTLFYFLIHASYLTRLSEDDEVDGWGKRLVTSKFKHLFVSHAFVALPFFPQVAYRKWYLENTASWRID